MATFLAWFTGARIKLIIDAILIAALVGTAAYCAKQYGENAGRADVTAKLQPQIDQLTKENTDLKVYAAQASAAASAYQEAVDSSKAVAAQAQAQLAAKEAVRQSLQTRLNNVKVTTCDDTQKQLWNLH